MNVSLIHKKFKEYKNNKNVRRVSGWRKDMGLLRDTGNPQLAAKAVIKNWSSQNKFPKTLIANPEIATFDALLSTTITESLYGEDLWIHKDRTDGSRINSHDYSFLSNKLMFPANNRVVIDFGAGYGRLANLISKLDWQVVIICDAIADSYAAQYLWLTTLARIADYRLVEYFDTKEFTNELVVKAESEPRPVMIHCPSAALPLLGRKYADLIIFNHVFNELDSNSAKFAMNTVEVSLKKEGSVYVRDHGWFSTENFIDRDQMFGGLNFIKTYQSPFHAKTETWGGVEIWTRYVREKHSFLKRYGVPLLLLKRSKAFLKQKLSKLIC